MDAVKFAVLLELRVRYYPGDFARQRTVSPALPNPYRRWFRFVEREIEDEGSTKVESRKYSALLTRDQFVRYEWFFGGTADTTGTQCVLGILGVAGGASAYGGAETIVFDMAGFDRYHENISGTLNALPITRRMEEGRLKKPLDPAKTEWLLLRIAKAFRDNHVRDPLEKRKAS